MHHDKLLEIQTDSTGDPLYVTYQDFLNSVSKNNFASFFDLFPNPTNGRLILNNKTFERIEINIYNSIGKKIYYEATEINKCEIDLTNEPDGIYFCTIKTNSDAVLTEKIILHK